MSYDTFEPIHFTEPTDRLPFIGGVHANDFRDVPTETIALTAAYVEPMNLADALQMAHDEVMALLQGQAPPASGIQRTNYIRGQFIVMAGAWVDIIIDSEHEPSPDDRRWMLANVADCLMIALAGGYTTPISTNQRIMARLRGSMTLGSWAAPAEGGRMSMTEWIANHPIVAEFDRQPIERFRAAERHDWRTFFDGLDDTWTMEADADVCWRCDARDAADNLGLCAHCREDMTHADE